MRSIIYLMVFSIFGLFISCEKEDDNLIKSEVNQQQIDERSNVLPLTMWDTTFDMYDIGAYHNHMIIESEQKVIDSFGSLDYQNWEPGMLSDIMQNTYENSNPPNGNFAFSLNFDEVGEFEELGQNHSDVEFKNILYDTLTSILNQLHNDGILDQTQYNYLSNVTDDVNSGKSSTHLYNNYVGQWSSVKNDSYSDVFVGLYLSIAIHSTDLWNNDLGDEDDEHPVIIGQALRDVGGAAYGFAKEIYNHWDCLDWGCTPDTGKEMLKSAGDQALSASTFGIL